MKAIEAIDKRPPIAKQVYEAQRDYWQAIQPLIKIKADVYSYAKFRLVLVPREEPRHEYLFTDQEKETLKRCDDTAQLLLESFTRYL